MTIIELAANLKKVNLTKIYKECIKELEAEIIDLNHSQLEVGKDSNSALLPEYQDQIHYKQFKQSIGSKSGGHYDFKVEGDFLEGFYGELTGENFKIDSKDSKRDRLVDLTSIYIFGLTNENTKKFVNDAFYPLFMSKLRKQIGIN